MIEKKITFPNGLECYYLSSKRETKFIFSEIFVEQEYIRNGILINSGDIIFDVGANIGLFSIYVNRLKENLKIYAFEPIEPIFDVLQKNILKHSKDNVSLFNFGLSSKYYPEKKFTFYPNLAGNSTTRPQEKLKQRDAIKANFTPEELDYFYQTQEIKGELKTLSYVIDELGIEKIDLLKIDVEGEEYEVLKGIEAKNWSKIKQIVMEVHDLQGRGDRIKRLLEKLGFNVIIEKNNLLPATANNLNLYALRTVPSNTK